MWERLLILSLHNITCEKLLAHLLGWAFLFMKYGAEGFVYTSFLLSLLLIISSSYQKYIIKENFKDVNF